MSVAGGQCFRLVTFIYFELFSATAIKSSETDTNPENWIEPRASERSKILETQVKHRLLVTTTTFIRYESDTQPRFVLDLSRALGEHFDVTVLAPSFPDAPLRETLFGVDVVRYRYAPRQSMELLAYAGGIMSHLRRRPLDWFLVFGLLWGQRRALRRLLREQKFDAIHAHWTLPQGVLAVTLPKSLRLPVITTSHGGDIHTFLKTPLKAALPFVLKRSDKVTVVSEELRLIGKDLMRGTGREEEIARIPMGVDVDHFARLSAKETSDAPDPQTEITIQFVGRLVEKKGVGILIDAMDHVLADSAGLPKARLQIIGDGVLRQSLEEYIALKGLSDHISFLGRRNHDELPKELGSADIFVVPSIEAADGDKEGLPVTLLEAASCRVPIIASESAGISNFIKHEQNGLLVPAGDARSLAESLKRLMVDQSLREKLARQAFEDVKSYDWKAIAAEYAQVINEALKPRQ